MNKVNERARSPFEMQRPQKYAVVVNPKSANGATGRHWERLAAAVGEAVGDFTLYTTAREGHATDLVREALRAGHDRIISAGGDGTHYEVVNGFFNGDTPLNPDASMAFLPVGTGSDYRKTLGIRKGRHAICWLASDRVLRADIGRLRVTTSDGQTVTRYFLNAVHTGIGGKVGEYVNGSNKVLGGFLTFLIGVVASRLTYRAQPMEVTADGRVFNQKCLEVIAAKGQYDGGGMHMSPGARLNNGWLEVSVIGDIGIIDTTFSLPLLYLGKQGLHRKVECFRAKRITITSPETVLVSPDGELAGQTPVTVEVVPGAIRLVTGATPPVEA